MIKKLLMGVVLGLLLVLAGGLAMVLGGLPNVAAGWRDPPILAWLLHTTYERSVARRAAGIEVPSTTDPGQVLAGARAFDEMCAICHTPSGREPTVQSAGLNPPPPALTELTARRTPEEAFWVIQNGVRMTAMPAFGPTHTDAELWQLVTFLWRARGLDGAGYDALLSRARRLPVGDGHAHRHGPDGADPPERAPAAAPAPGGHDHHEGDDAHAH